MNIEISGVNFAVHVPRSVTLRDYPAVYRPFINSVYSGARPVNVKIDLVVDRMPDTGGMNLLFDTEQSWSLFGEGDNYFFALRAPDEEKETVCVAHFIKGNDTITVCCGEVLVNHSGGGTYLSSPFSYPLDQLLLMYVLAQNEGFLVHASGIVMNGKGYIFPGRSGAGKTTISRQFLCRDSLQILSDDRVVARKINNSFQVFGAPWAGEAGIARNMNAPLGGIFFIRHGSENSIRELKSTDALKRLMPVVSIPWYDKETMPDILSSCETIVSCTPAFELCFRPDNQAAVFFEQFASLL
jgi:hypothetical protein